MNEPKSFFDIEFAKVSAQDVHNRLVKILTTSPETPIGEVSGEIGRLIALNAFYLGMTCALEMKSAGKLEQPPAQPAS